MLRYTRLFTGKDGTSQFEDVEVPLTPDEPAPHELSVSQPISASAVLFGRAPAQGSHPEQPEPRRQLMIGLTGSVEVTTADETRVFGPGDVLLAEDLEGPGHSSRTSEGFTVAVVVL
jgi:quercetin dioxygenase-like cupin family protein